MGDIFQRNSMALGGPRVAPIDLGQYGIPRPDISQTSPLNTAGGIGIPNLGEPTQNFLSPTEIHALGGGRGMDWYQKFGMGFQGNRGSGGSAPQGWGIQTPRLF